MPGVGWQVGSRRDNRSPQSLRGDAAPVFAARQPGAGLLPVRLKRLSRGAIELRHLHLVHPGHHNQDDDAEGNSRQI